VLAHVLRTDRDMHWPLPADSELAQAIAVLARAQQDAVWDRTCAHNKLRSHLREYFPGFLAAFAAARGGITRPRGSRRPGRRPHPGRGRRADPDPAARPAEKAGRSRGTDTEATRLRDAFRTKQMRQLPSARSRLRSACRSARPRNHPSRAGLP